MLSPADFLNRNGIHLPSYEPGRRYTTCPQCSSGRSTAASRKAECLGVTIEADGSVRWGCNHCGWTGPQKGDGKRGNGGDGPPLPFYLYRDKDGEIRFRKVRNAPGARQRFFIQHWTGAEWANGSGKADTSILYRADDLAQAIAEGRTILCAEGEKDVDNLWRLGFAATCNAHGASDPTKNQRPKWTKRHSEQLAGVDVVVLDDNDAAGYAHAEATCKLSLGVAKRVRRLDLKDAWPDIPQGGDVSDWLAQGHTRAELEALIVAAPDYAPQPEPKLATRPEILLSAGKTEQIVGQIEDLLIASDRGLYQRGGIIVSAGFTKMKTWDKTDVIVQVIEERGHYAIAEDMEAVADFLGYDKKGKLRPCNPPQRIVLTLKDRKSRLRLPTITGVANCPSISVDGELLDRPGFDPETGVLFDPLGVKFPRVPDFPTKADAQSALARILRAIETFKFVGEDDKAVALSTIITAVARRGLPFAPGHGFDAPVAGSGKSKLVDIAAIIATGRRAAVMSQGEPEEFAKAFGAVLMSGDPMVAIDNCSHPLEGDLLNQALTQEFVKVRILGFSKMVTVQTKALITYTGNNLQVLGDLTRRSVIGRLDPKCERPELEQFNFDPIAYAMENRPQLVVDCLIALKAYHNAGRPGRPPRLQSFEHWSDTVRSALIWLGQGDPVKTMERLRKNDSALSNAIAVLSSWRDEFADERVSADEVIERAEAHSFIEVPGTGLYPMREKQFTHPRLRNALLAVAKKSGQLDANALSYWLRSVKERVLPIGEPGHEFRAALVAEGTKHGHVAAWKLEKRS